MRCNDHVCHQSVVFSAQYSGGLWGCQVGASPIIGWDIRLLLPCTGDILWWSQQPIRRQTKLKTNQCYALIIVNPWIQGGLARWSYVRLADTSWSVMLTLDTDNLLIKPDINLFHDSLPHRHHRWRFDKALFSVTFWFVYDSALACCVQDWWFLVGSDNSVSPRYSFYPPSFEDTLMIN